MQDFANKVAVITGAANGFGREFAKLGASYGMKLVLADVDKAALAKLERELQNQGVETLSKVCDVRSSEDIQALADATIARFGSVHLLFNNAGVGTGGLIWEASEADWDWVLGVNLKGVIHGVRIFTPLMLQFAKADPNYRGHIVNTASMAGLVNMPNLGVYNVSKHAVVSLTETLYHDLQLIKAPIGVSVLCPYFVATGIHQSERNRPQDMQNQSGPTASQVASQLLLDKAVNASKLTAEQVAQMTFDSIKENRFYIYSHPELLDGAKTRMEDLLHQKNPSDPYATAPRIKAILQAKLKS